MMHHKRSHAHNLLGLGVLLLICTLFLYSTAYAETYLGGQFGVTLPGDLTNIDITTTGFTAFKQSNLDLDTSYLYGAKLGHYFGSARWLGLETEVFVTQPGIKQQDVTLTGPSGSTTFTGVPGFNFRVVTWAPLNIELRYPGRRFQPYVGAGPGIFFARVKDSVTGDQQTDDWSLGLNAHAGLRFFLVRRLALFAEAKYTGLTRFKFKETPNLDGYDATYNAFHGVLGVSYHF